MVLWDEGFVEPNRFDSMDLQPRPGKRERYLSGGISEVSKGYYYTKHHPAPYSVAPDPLGAAKNHFLRRTATTLRDPRPVAAEFEMAVARGAPLATSDYDLADYFYLDEHVRCWNSAHTAFNLFRRGVQPFLNIDHIKLAFALTPVERGRQLFQKHLIAVNAPGLLHVDDPGSREPEKR